MDNPDNLLNLTMDVIGSTEHINTHSDKQHDMPSQYFVSA